jgi:hypothetical protein
MNSYIKNYMLIDDRVITAPLILYIHTHNISYYTYPTPAPTYVCTPVSLDARKQEKDHAVTMQRIRSGFQIVG